MVEEEERREGGEEGGEIQYSPFSQNYCTGRADEVQIHIWKGRLSSSW